MAARRWIKLIALCALVVLSMQKRLKKRAEPKERSIIQEMDALNVSEGAIAVPLTHRERIMMFMFFLLLLDRGNEEAWDC